MAEWGINTPWRQGKLLSRASAESLQIISSDDSAEVAAIVVSHDCDLAQKSDVEPQVEVIVGRFVKSADGNFMNARSARTLHLQLDTRLDDRSTIELSALKKRLVSKDDLADHVPDEDIILSLGGIQILQHWLSIRYYRAAFPTEFVTRLSKSNLDIDGGLKDILKKAESELRSVYFGLDNGVDVERDDGSEYKLEIFLVAASDADPEVVQAKLAVVREKIVKLFTDKCFDGTKWKSIELIGCEITSENEMTLYVARQLKRWNADYLSLRNDPGRPIDPGLTR